MYGENRCEGCHLRNATVLVPSIPSRMCAPCAVDYWTSLVHHGALYAAFNSAMQQPVVPAPPVERTLHMEGG